MIIDTPSCDWVSVPFKDKRKGAFWLCRACGAMAKGKKQPACPCKSIDMRSNGACDCGATCQDIGHGNCRYQASDCEKRGGRTAPLSCPDCHDESDCSHVDVCRAVEEVYRPSDRPADVTVAELAHWLLHNLSLDAHPVKDARALLDAFKVGRR